ncbi:uncharacterized protein LOC109546141 [Dendroctonus ponderosae]|uniref:Uncharacterized protein n=1 Tax=Dendroctonus ponderosae TaxID=77166 RepID=A0AAR5QH97_DENPD|nr:uncharacterized protein LOC109546141 [Dendroctonus ponderosae]
MRLLVIFILLCSVISGIRVPGENQNVQIRDTSQQLLSRKKRWLVYKEGTNWVSVIFGIGIPVPLQFQSLTLGMVMKAFYLLPTNSTYYTHPTISTIRRKRSATRWKIYEIIENYLERNKYPDGKACLLKSICEVSAVPLEQNTGLIAEIFHSILTPSSTDDEIENHIHNEYHAAEKIGKEVKNCAHIFPECPIDPVQQFSKFMTVNKFVH